MNIPLDSSIRNETEKNIGDDETRRSHKEQEDASKVSCSETKSEGDSSSRKSDSSDSSSWIRVLDKEGILIFSTVN